MALQTGRLFRLAPGATLFGLAPCGVLPATRVTTGAVRSYRTFSPLPLATGAASSAVCFLCHFPSGCPDRALPGALPCGVRTFLPPSRLLRAATAGDRLAHCEGSIVSVPTHHTLPGLPAPPALPHPPDLSVGLLADLILFELLVEIAARRADHFGRLRDVPAVLAQLADQEHPLGVLLELTQRARPGGLAVVRLLWRGRAAARARPCGRRSHGLRQIRGLDRIRAGHDDHPLDGV